MINIAAFSGSLRNKSLNTALIKAAEKLLPENTTMTILGLGRLPLYNEDLIPDNIPASVTAFRSGIEKAHGLLIAAPEYNYSMTGVLKNALDWAGTDTIGNVLDGKPVALMGASKTVFGTVRAQQQVRQVLLAVNADPLQRPEIFVRRAQDIVREDGSIDDERTLSKLNNLIASLINKILPD